MTIRASLSDANGNLKLEGTKTDRVRTCPLADLALDALRARRTESIKERLAAGRVYADDGFVFADAIGAPMVPDTLTKAFAKAATAAAVRNATLHTLRHTTATWLLANGADIHTVQQLLGRSVPATTLNIHARGTRASGQGSLLSTIASQPPEFGGSEREIPAGPPDGHPKA